MCHIYIYIYIYFFFTDCFLYNKPHVCVPVPVSVFWGGWMGLSPGAGHSDNDERDIVWGTELA